MNSPRDSMPSLGPFTMQFVELVLSLGWSEMDQLRTESTSMSKGKLNCLYLVTLQRPAVPLMASASNLLSNLI